MHKEETKRERRMRSLGSNSKDLMHNIDEADLRKFKQMQNVGMKDIKDENKQK